MYRDVEKKGPLRSYGAGQNYLINGAHRHRHRGHHRRLRRAIHQSWRESYRCWSCEARSRNAGRKNTRGVLSCNRVAPSSRGYCYKRADCRNGCRMSQKKTSTAATLELRNRIRPKADDSQNCDWRSSSSPGDLNCRSPAARVRNRCDCLVHSKSVPNSKSLYERQVVSHRTDGWKKVLTYGWSSSRLRR